jgi:hypothetical protein
VRLGRALSLAATTALVLSLAWPACDSPCGDSAPGYGESCSGTAICGQPCSASWACQDGKWTVGDDVCAGPGYREPLDAGTDGDADTGSDADANPDANACDARGGEDDAAPLPPH